VSVYVEDWQASYGSPYLVVPEEAVDGAATLVEDGDDLVAHHGNAGSQPRVAFIDGVRRVEASLYQVDDRNGSVTRGVAGAHASGAVLIDSDDPRPTIGHVEVARHVIFGSGQIGALPPVAGGWAWHPSSVADPDPDAPLAELQRRMRQAEGLLAEQLCTDGWLTIVDGPLTYVRSADQPVVGYVKTHRRMLLAPAEHTAVPGMLRVGVRTSLFAHADRYSSYLRIVDPDPHAGPWSGVVRLEVPQSAGLASATATADAVTGFLPPFAGVRHRDPRAPQNLQPVGALEKHLRHLLGSPALAVRAVRDAVAQLRTPPTPAAS
jgi:hypothetical protein